MQTFHRRVYEGSVFRGYDFCERNDQGKERVVAVAGHGIPTGRACTCGGALVSLSPGETVNEKGETTGKTTLYGEIPWVVCAKCCADWSHRG